MALARRFTVEPIWNGRTVAVIGSGASFSTRQARALAIARNAPGSNLRIIAVNDGIFPCFFADWLHAGDQQWWYWHIQHCHAFTGTKTTLAEDVPAAWIDGYLKNTGREGFDPDPSQCRTGGSSAYQAMCIAVHTGAKRIILVGIDLHGPHYFGDHPDGIKSDYASTMEPQFPKIIPTLEERGIAVVNASPSTRLKCFPIVDLETELTRTAS